MEQERVPTKHQVAGSPPALITCKELWQTWCMRGTENPDNVVRFHEAPLMESYMIPPFNGYEPFCGLMTDSVLPPQSIY